MKKIPYLSAAFTALESGSVAVSSEKVKNNTIIENVLIFDSAVKSNLSAIPINIRFYGLLPTIAMFGIIDTDENSGRNTALYLIEEVLKLSEYLTLNKLIDLLQFNQNAYNLETEKRQLAQEIVKASFALKLAIRTFNINK